MPRLSFEQWKRKVNQHVIGLTGLSADDLPDWDYGSAWEDEVPPDEAAERMLEYVCDEMGFDFDEVFGNQ